MYGEFHPLTYKGKGEKLLFGLTLSESIWIGSGLYASAKLVEWFPPIPFLPLGLNYIHCVIPILFCVFMAFAKHPNGLSITQYIISRIQFELRPRVLVYRRGGVEDKSD